jgi:hypothetical protein
MVIFLPTLMILSAISSEYLGFQERERILPSGPVTNFQTLWDTATLLDGPSSALSDLLVLAPEECRPFREE